MSDDATRARGLDLDTFAQTLRTAHCASKESGHPCVGTCKITPRGVELECQKCGGQHEDIAPGASLDEVKVAIAALAGVGIVWDALAPDTQRTIYLLVKRTDLVRRRGSI